jgi:hypothetical protein
MKKTILLINLIWVTLASCQDNRDLKIFLPENFTGYGAIVFNKRGECTMQNQTVLVQIDSLGIGYASAGDCFIQSGVNGHYFFYSKKGDSYTRVISLVGETCEEAIKLQGLDALYFNGGTIIGFEDYSVLVFHIGKCGEQNNVDSPEGKKIEEMVLHYIDSLKQKKVKLSHSK